MSILTPQQAAQLVLDREEARQSFCSYIDYMKAHADLSDFDQPPAKHHEILIEELQRAADTDRAKMTCSMPPGSAKSHYSSVLFPTWLLCRDPKTQVICASNSEDLAGAFSRRRRSICTSKAWEALAQSKLDKNAKSLQFLGTIDQGGIKAVSSGGSITGHRCDVIIHDDLTSGHEMAASTTQMQKLWNWFLVDARTRLKPKGKEIIVATRFCSIDPTGRAMEMSAAGLERWRHIRMPLVCDSEDDVLGRKIGETMWKSWFTPAFCEEAKRDDRNFRCLFQQRPIDERGRWCDESHIHRIQRSKVPDNIKTIIAVDIALTLGGGDFSIFVHVGIDANKTLYILDVYRAQESPDVTSAMLVTWVQKYKPGQVIIDDDNASKVWSQLVALQARNTHTPMPLRLISHGNRDKEVRAAAIRSHLLSDRVRIVENQETKNTVEEILAFPSPGHPDDLIDAISLVGREYLKLSAPKAPRQANTVSVSGFGEGALQKIDGKLVLRTTLNEMFEDRERERKAMPTFMSRRI